MHKILLIAIFTVLFTSCGNTYEFWEVSKFNISTNALSDNEEVTIIYYSRGPFDEDVDEGFYRHAIIVSNRTNDTVNVLTFPDFSLDNITETNRTLVYNNHPVLSDIFSDSESIPSGLDQSKMSWAKHHKVARDPKFDQIADNDYPSVIGSLTKK
jgi:hypothetical protein